MLATPTHLIFFLLAYNVFFLFNEIKAQNLVPNADFEFYTDCPVWLSGMECIPWGPGNAGTPDYFHVCAAAWVCDVPNNAHGYQEPRSGDAYVGSAVKDWGEDYREYVLAPLLEPLQPGMAYWVSFYVNLADNDCGVQTIGALFTEGLPVSNGSEDNLEYAPQIESNFGYITDDEGWTLVSGCFLATGGEDHITIGNFHDDANTPLDPDCSGNGATYYFFEDVSVEAVVPEFFDIELGDPVVACDSYEIEFDYPHAFITWSDGSHGSSITITESGTYAVTVADSCSFGIDMIEVTIIHTVPVDLGPADTLICEGEVIAINLDPDLGNYEWNDGSSNSDYEITTAGTYSVTLDNGCNQTTDQMDATVIIPPGPIDLGPDQFICTGDAIPLTVDQDAGNIIWHDNSTSETFIASSGGTYAVTISNMCGTESDEILLTDLSEPEINFPDDVHYSCIGSIYDIAIDPSLGDILWSDGSTDANYEITETGIYTVYISNECGTGSDMIEVEFLDNPDFSFGPDVNICPGDTVILNGNSILGEYLWQDGSTGTELEVTGPGLYALTISNGCGAGTDTIVVTYEPTLNPPNLGPDLTLCPGEQTVLRATTSGANYSWQNMSTADTLVVNTGGTYYVNVYNACQSYSDTIVVSINATPPQVDLPVSVTLCQGQTYTINAGIGGVTYLWNDNSQNAQLDVSAPGTYSLTVTNACGSDIDSIIISDGGPAPLVELGNNLDFCPGETLHISPTFSDVDTWLWSNGSFLQYIDVTTPGVISVIVTNSCGTSYDTIVTSLLPDQPSFNLGIDTAMCPGSSITLTINLPNVEILWSDGTDDPTFLVSTEGQYHATISNACGEYTDSIEIRFLPDIPVLELGDDQSLCPGELILINPGVADVDYLWHDGSTDETYSTTIPETITLTISNECGSATDEIFIIENTSGPQLDLGPDVKACAGDVVTISSGISGVDYLWQDGSVSSNFTTTTPGEFILNVSNNCGEDSDTIIINFQDVPSPLTLGNDTTLCSGETLTLQSPVTSNQIEWQDGSSQPLFIVSSPGLFFLHESNECGIAGDSIMVDFQDKPVPFSLGNDTTLCPGESITLLSPVTSDHIEWQDGSSGPTYIADQQQLYSLQISNQCGVASDELQVTVIEVTPVLEFDEVNPICSGDVITLDATQTFTAAYIWNTGATSSAININTPGTYAVTVITECSSLEKAIDIKPADDCKEETQYFIPNVFSPNDDGINDFFEIHFNSEAIIVSISGEIFDRWGNLLFASKTIPFQWDGTSYGSPLNPGVYTYRISLHYSNGVNIITDVLRGDVTIIR